MDDGDREILNDFKRTRQKTIELLSRIPTSMLAEKADGEEVTMGELFHHIAATVDGWMARCMQDGGELPGRYKASKPAILRGLESSERRLLKFFNAKKGAAMKAVYRPTRKGKKYRFVGRDRVLYLTQHEAHHRGKIVLALRQWGFEDIPYLPY